MATILLKRGQATSIGELTLQEGEVAIAYNEEKSSAQLYVGGADNQPILVTADVAAAVKTALGEAKQYTDTTVTAKIDALINGAPGTLDTLMELATAIQENQSAVQAINSAITDKVDKEEGKGLSEADFTSEEKTKLEGIADGANKYVHPEKHEATIITEDTTHRFVTDEEKEEWSGKLGADDTINGGTF